MKNRLRLPALVFVLILVCAAPARAQREPAREHPYLFFSRQDIPALRERVSRPEIAPFYRKVRAAALSPGRERATNSILCSGIAYQLSGDRRYAEQGVRLLMSAVTSPRPWVRRTAEIKYCDLSMATRAISVAYGYDLLYDVLTEEQRSLCRETLRQKVFAPFLKIHAVHDRQRRLFTDEAGHWEWWTTGYFNWNSWVNGGIGLAGLAMLDEVPEAGEVVRVARESLKYVHYEFDQGESEDGGWDEGPMYWGAAVGHAVRFYAALERVLGTDDGFFELPGMPKTLQYAIDFTAPDGTWVNFADCNNRLVLDPPSELYFLARRYDNRQFMRHLDDNSAEWHVLPFAVLWRPVLPAPAPAPRQRVRLYRDIHWAVLTSGGLFLPFKAGDLAANHGHRDANSLLLWVHGERMLNDPGYGRRETEDHNALLVNGLGQRLNEEPFPWGTRPRSFGRYSNSVGRILQCGTVGGDPYLVSEASSCYAGMLERYQRHVVLAEGDYVVVFDDVEAVEPSEFTVNWHTLWQAAGTGQGQALFTGRLTRLHLVARADRPVATAVGRARYDRAFRIDSAGPSKGWRLFTVLAPGEAPLVRTAFTADRAAVRVNGREHAFERTEDGSYRYAAGTAGR